MPNLSEFNRFGEEIEKRMLLRTSPIAVKMLEKESDIPEGAIRPKKDRGYHLAQCQAFSLSRRNGNLRRHVERGQLVLGRFNGLRAGGSAHGGTVPRA